MNPDCNYLAYLRNLCYGLRKFNYVIDLKMSALERIRDGFAAVALASATIAAPACAQEDMRTSAQPTQIAMTTTAAISHNVSVVEDADYAANEYVVDSPERLAISVRIGEDTLVPAERVEEVLRRDLAAYGRRDISFFYERGERGDTTVSYHTDGRVFGSYPLATAREQIPQVMSQFSFNQRYASNMN